MAEHSFLANVLLAINGLGTFIFNSMMLTIVEFGLGAIIVGLQLI